MPSVLAPVIAFYDYALQPVPALAWLGASVSALDVAGALRLAVVLRQQRELFHEQHVAKMAEASHGTNNRAGGKSGGKAQRAAAAIDPPQPRSRVRDFAATLVIVHGGEAIAGAFTISGYLSFGKSIDLTFLGVTLDWTFVSISLSTLARPATFVHPVQYRSRVISRRPSTRRPIAYRPQSILIYRASPDHNPRALSYDPVMQCDPKSGCRTRLA